MEKTLDFSIQIFKYCDGNEKFGPKVRLKDQLFRSGTSIGANVYEAQAPESKKDFIHKLKVAAKEALETEYWLLLGKEVISENTTNDLLDKLNEIQRIISASINTAKKKLPPH